MLGSDLESTCPLEEFVSHGGVTFTQLSPRPLGDLDDFFLSSKPWPSSQFSTSSPFATLCVTTDVCRVSP